MVVSDMVERPYDEEKDFLLAEKVKHTLIIFRLLDNINRASFHGNDFAFLRGIDTLESNIPDEWEDDKYKEEMEQIKKKSKREFVLLGTYPTDKAQSDLLYEFAQKKLRAIINLLDRRGMFGERDIEEVI